MSFDYGYMGYNITADVREYDNTYGIGDSPTLYEVDLLAIMDDDGSKANTEDLGKFFYNDLIDEAIRVYKE